MKNNLYQVGSLLLVIMLMVTSVSCSNKVETTYDNLPNSKPNPQNGDLVQVVEGILPDYSVNDLIKLSEIVVIGSVTEILPAQKGIRKESGTNLIYTDVVITPDRILNGKVTSQYIIVRVWGGRVGGETEIYEQEPVFTINERVLVFLSEFTSVFPADSSNNLAYHRVVGGLLGKYRVEADRATNQITNRKINIAEVERQINTIYQ